MAEKPMAIPASALPATGRLQPLRLFAMLLTVGFLGIVISVGWVPWQQSVRGEGRVIAYAPLERQQAIEAPIDGRVVRWYVQEGDRVAAGTPVAELSDNDPEILARLEREREAARAQVDSIALSITLTEDRIQSLSMARESAVNNARLRVKMAHEREEAAQRAIDAARAAVRTADLNLSRQQSLHQKGLASKRDLELAELAAETAATDLARARASLRAAQAEVGAFDAERGKVSSSAQASIDSTRSSIEKLKAEKAKAEAELAKVEVRLARQEQMQITAPRDGTILRLVAKQGTEMVKAGEPLVVLVPEAGSRAVELYVDGNDAPLIDPGREVRIQFEGWPAVQFVGWPSVAVGTFPAKVAFVDAHDDGQGHFRIVVVPKKQSDWPDGRYLRQGVRANGWILLNQVTIGFELWRQFNGFPPVISPSQEPNKYIVSGEKT